MADISPVKLRIAFRGYLWESISTKMRSLGRRICSYVVSIFSSTALIPSIHSCHFLFDKKPTFFNNEEEKSFFKTYIYAFPFIIISTQQYELTCIKHLRLLFWRVFFRAGNELLPLMKIYRRKSTLRSAYSSPLFLMRLFLNLENDSTHTH